MLKKGLLYFWEVKRMSFEEMLNRIKPRLRAISRRLQRKYVLLSEQDLYQEAVLHLWEESRPNALCDKTESYVLQGCYFNLKNYIRKNRDKACLLSLENNLNAENEAPNLDDILPLEDRHSCFELVNAKLLTEKINNNGLTPREKEVFLLALEGLTTREIGARLGISHVRVVKLRAKIKDKCKKYVE